jgi:glucose-1-phosphate thymidylyltransferase
VEIDRHANALSIEEKPEFPRSHIAVPGLYFYDEKVSEISATFTLSNRRELEVTDLNRAYLKRGQMGVENLGRGSAWLDAGTHEYLLDASSFVHTLEKRQGLKIACAEEVAFRMNCIDATQLRGLASLNGKSDNGLYLYQILDETTVLEEVKS